MQHVQRGILIRIFSNSGCPPHPEAKLCDGQSGAGCSASLSYQPFLVIVPEQQARILGVAANHPSNPSAHTFFPLSILSVHMTITLQALSYLYVSSTRTPPHLDRFKSYIYRTSSVGVPLTDRRVISKKTLRFCCRLHTK